MLLFFAFYPSSSFSSTFTTFYILGVTARSSSKTSFVGWLVQKQSRGTATAGRRFFLLLPLHFIIFGAESKQKAYYMLVYYLARDSHEYFFFLSFALLHDLARKAGKQGFRARRMDGLKLTCAGCII